MAAATLQPAAGAAGELTGLLLMRAWHEAQGATRHKVIIPDSAHGTNPASVTLGGYEVVTVPSDDRGCVDMAALRAVLDEDVAGIMLTNPNTLGLFEEDIAEIAAAVHEVGGLLYYDGANLNAILGVVRPGDMGFDIVHMNLHKTFATPHGGGGPGAGPVAVSERLVPFLPGPRPVPHRVRRTRPTPSAGRPRRRAIGRVHSWHGNTLVLARALAYILANGGDGLKRIAQVAVLNANWIRQRLHDTYDVPFDRPCMHEVVLSATTLKAEHGVRALDVAKRLLEEGFHAPTVYFPLIVDEALMIEPTETESPQTLEALAVSLERIAAEAARDGAEALAAYPHGTPVRRVDEARAARHPDPHLRRPGLRRQLRWTGSSRPDSSTRTCGSTSGSTSGRTAGSASTPNRIPALLLTTTGRKSGLARTNGLTYCADRGDLIVVASNGGSDRPPAWLLNLQADPRVTGPGGPARVIGATARVATDEEQAQLWPKVNRTNRGMSRLFHPGVTGRYDVYQRHTSRRIPVVVIHPDRPPPEPP